MNLVAKLLVVGFLFSLAACTNPPKQGDDKKEAQEGFEALDKHNK